MTKNLNIIAPLNQLGYGVAGTNIALALHQVGIKVSLFPIGPQEVDHNKSLILDELKANASEFDNAAPCLRIWHQNDMAEFVGRGMHVGFPFFELDRFNFRELHHLRTLDRIFVTSEWGREVLRNNKVDVDVRIVPLGVDLEIFRPDLERPKSSLDVDHTAFIAVGKWERRKGHDFLIQAFCKAFQPSDKVSLRMVCSNPFIGARNDEWGDLYKKSPMGRNIKLIPRLTSQSELATIMNDADCGLFPARAEGWNLELLEMMALGRAIICTNNSGHTAFVTSANSRLIECNETEPAQDGIWFHGFGNWAKLGPCQEEQFIHHLREVHRLKQSGGLKRNDEGIKTASRLTWRHSAYQLLKGLE